MSANEKAVPGQLGLPGTGVRIWSTESVAASDAVDYWRDVVCDLYVRLSTEPMPGRPFSGEVSHRGYGDFELSVIRASGEKVRRTRSMIAHSREADEYLYATVQTRGHGVLEQAGRLAELEPGSLVFYDTSEPFTLQFLEEWEQVIVHVPVARALASAGLKRSRDLLAVPLDTTGAAGATAMFIRSLAEKRLQDADGVDLLAQHVPGLVASTLNILAASRSRAEQSPNGLPDSARRECVVAFLRTRLGDPELTPDVIAQSCHMSRRTLYRLFQGIEGSVMGRLRQLRVENAQLLLRQHPDRPVSPIGRQCGFPSDGQFHRVFRKLTGTTPAGYRDAVPE